MAGEMGSSMTVGADQFVTIERGMAEAIPWQPGREHDPVEKDEE